MASKRIKRLIELILDGGAARKAEKATQDSLNKGTDPKKAKKNVSEIEKSMSRVQKAALGIGAAIGAAAVFGFRKFIKESSEAQKSSAQLAAVVKSTGGAAGRTTAELEAQATALQKVTTFSDDAVMSAQSLLLTFTGIKGQTFDKATETVLDLATAMGGGEGSLKSASIQVGKALNDPIKGVTALTKVGVSFTDSQKEMIKSLTESGHLVEAQAIILKELEKEFGGSARAARDTLGGALEGLSNAWGEMFEVTGEGTRGMVGAINALIEWLPKLRAVVDNVFGAIQDQWHMIQLNLAGFYSLLGRLSSHIPMLKNWSDAWTKAGNAIRTSVEMATGTGRFARMGQHKPAMRVIVDDTEDAAEATDKLRKAEDARLALLVKAVDLGIERHKEDMELLQIYMQTEDALRKGNISLEERVRLTERLKDAQAGLANVTKRDIKAPTVTAASVGPTGIKLPSMAQMTHRTTQDVVGGQGTRFLVDNLEEITSAAQVAALGIQQSFEDAFSALGEEGNAFGNFFGKLFEGMAASALGAIAQIAAGKVAENIAYAVEALAKGLLFGDPKALASAAVFGKAAALWAVVGGITGAAAKAAGGGSGSTRPGADVVGREIDKVDRGGPDIVIKLDGVDPKNPRHQRLIGETSREYQQRHGGRVRLEGA